MITAVDRAAAFAQQMVRANLGTERLGWERPAGRHGAAARGHGHRRPRRRTCARVCVETPVLLPTWGWPPTRTTVPPDDPAYDLEQDQSAQPGRAARLALAGDAAARPAAGRRTTEADPGSCRSTPTRSIATSPATPTVVDAYQAIAARHQHALGHLRNARQILFRGNFAVVRFNELDGGEVEAVHEVYTAFSDPDQPAAEEPKPEPYMVQVASLGPRHRAGSAGTSAHPRDRTPPPRSRRRPVADQTFLQKIVAEVVSILRVRRRRARRGAGSESGAPRPRRQPRRGGRHARVPDGTARLDQELPRRDRPQPPRPTRPSSPTSWRSSTPSPATSSRGSRVAESVTPPTSSSSRSST